MNLHIDTTQRELKKVVAAKQVGAGRPSTSNTPANSDQKNTTLSSILAQDTMVDENIIKLEVKR